MTSPLQQKLKITGPTVVTANRLADGVVVWLTADHRWSTRLVDAAVATTSDAVLSLLAVAGQDENTAVGAYAARVEESPQGPRPLTLRERIRVNGPTLDLDLSA